MICWNIFNTYHFGQESSALSESVAGGELCIGQSFCNRLAGIAMLCLFQLFVTPNCVYGGEVY